MARGYNSFADVMKRTADGRDFNDLYNEFRTVAELANEQQQRFIDMLTTPTDSPVVSVLQSLGGGAGFQEASEYGVPQSARTAPSVLDMGATFKWYDNAWRSTWQYLADVTAAQLEAATAAIIADDADLMFNKVMGTVFNPVNSTWTDQRANTTYNVFAFANGDGWVPPAYAGNTFNGTHSHYRISGAAAVTSGDLDEIVDDFKSHGYSEENGSQIVIFVNATEGNVINAFRVGSGARSDFVAAAGSRFFSANGDLIGDQPAATFAGFKVKGAYDEALIIESSRIPAGYVVALASGGSFAPSNPIMLREHSRLKGLQFIGGNRSDYPLVDSYWVRGFGTGVRHRLAGMVMQVKASGSYAAPALYVP